jgi:hypothetical protein
MVDGVLFFWAVSLFQALLDHGYVPCRVGRV